MSVRSRIVLAVLWVLSLVVVAQLAGRAQTQPTLGQEIRFLRSAHRVQATVAFSSQTLVANGCPSRWTRCPMETCDCHGRWLRDSLSSTAIMVVGPFP